jgi:DNA mismatch endonuclease (patch repair protein)
MAKLPKTTTTKRRSDNMRAIKATSNASTELRFRGLLIRNAVKGWKVREPSVLGTPDFFFREQRLAIFIDGCFWHGCPRCGHVPKSNRPYWTKKLARNKNRDRETNRTLKREGIDVLRIWECQLRKGPKACLSNLLRLI